jgi:serine/threonine-protein kinase ULK/ATG1
LFQNFTNKTLIYFLVLNGKQYDNKADIWSIGTVFYELLFGKPPFLAQNMIELIQTVQTKQLEFPKKINPISPIIEDVLKKMLVVDP